MARQRRSAEDLTVDELRQILIEKRRSERQKRLEHYRRTGRVILVESVPAPAPIDSLQSEPLLPDDDLGAARPRSRGKVWLDRMLILVEVAAVAGLLFIILTGANFLQKLNKDSLASFVQPTPSPTPLISAVVLPDGHTPPRDGISRFNDAEIPEHLRPLVQSLAEIPAPTPSPQHAVQVKISAINISAPVVQGDGWEQLKKGVGQHIGTANPGETGNVVLAAHNDVYGMLFRDLDKLKPGDEVVLLTQQRAYTYVVRQTQIVEPSQVEVMDQTREPVVTLISCYPYLVDKQRIVVTAYLAEGN